MYPVKLGKNLKRVIDREMGGDVTRRIEQKSELGNSDGLGDVNFHPTEQHYILRYDFLPASTNAVDTPGLVEVTPSLCTNLNVKNDGAEGGIQMKGKFTKSEKDTECVLVFDGQSFRLEMIDGMFTQMRHVRRGMLKKRSIP